MRLSAGVRRERLHELFGAVGGAHGDGRGLHRPVRPLLFGGLTARFVAPLLPDGDFLREDGAAFGRGGALFVDEPVQGAFGCEFVAPGAELHTGSVRVAVGEQRRDFGGADAAALSQLVGERLRRGGGHREQADQDR